MKIFSVDDHMIPLEYVFESIPVAVAVVGRDGRYIALNDALAQLKGVGAEALVGTTTKEISVESGDNVRRDFILFDAGGQVADHELQIGAHSYLVSVRPVRDKSGFAVAEIVSLTDITRNKEIEQKLLEANKALEYLAAYDCLTGVLNARTYYEMCDRMINAANRNGRPFSLLFVDADFFKAVNDRYGHEAGDYVLKEIAASLGSVLRACDVVGRVGGEEFSIFLPETAHEAAMNVAENIRAQVAATPLWFNDARINITVSIGVSSKMAHHCSISDIQRDADHAMYHAKRNGRDRVECLVEPCYIEDADANGRNA